MPRLPDELAALRPSTAPSVTAVTVIDAGFVDGYDDLRQS